MGGPVLALTAAREQRDENKRASCKRVQVFSTLTKCVDSGDAGEGGVLCVDHTTLVIDLPDGVMCHDVDHSETAERGETHSSERISNEVEEGRAEGTNAAVSV